MKTQSITATLLAILVTTVFFQETAYGQKENSSLKNYLGEYISSIENDTLRVVFVPTTKYYIQGYFIEGKGQNGENESWSIVSVDASNGSITAITDAGTTRERKIDDFGVFKKIQDGEYDLIVNTYYTNGNDKQVIYYSTQ